jgi:predicted Zn-dependent protease
MSAIKYTPKQLPEEQNLNAPKHSFKKDLLIPMGIVLGVLLAIYLVLGWVVDFAVSKASPETVATIERGLGSALDEQFPSSPEHADAERELQRILDDLRQGTALAGGNYRVSVHKDSDVNALAIPGGRIVVTTALLEAVKSENELAMVLGHELAHFANRDHLRGLGRGIVLLIISTAALGGNDPASSFLQGSIGATQLTFSRAQESAADALGLDLVLKRYGHAGGCVDFFRQLDKKEGDTRWIAMLRTHPASASRVDDLNKLISERGAATGELTPLPPTLQKFSKSE